MQSEKMSSDPDDKDERDSTSAEATPAISSQPPAKLSGVAGLADRIASLPPSKRDAILKKALELSKKNTPSRSPPRSENE